MRGCLLLGLLIHGSFFWIISYGSNYVILIYSEFVLKEWSLSFESSQSRFEKENVSRWTSFYFNFASEFEIRQKIKLTNFDQNVKFNLQISSPTFLKLLNWHWNFLTWLFLVWSEYQFLNKFVCIYIYFYS